VRLQRRAADGHGMLGASVQIAAVIPARGGSKGVPRKNLLRLGRHTLVALAVGCAQRAGIETILLSTDDAEIAEEGRRAGAWVPALRPAELASDAARTLDAVLHVLAAAPCAPDAVLLLQPTSPLRGAEDVRAAIELLEARADADAVVSVARLQEPHPAKVKRIENGWLTPFVPGSSSETPRQELPSAWRLNGAIYLVRHAAMLRERTLMPRATLPLVMPAERSLNVDHPWDVVLVQALLERGLVKLEDAEAA
jgi:CMP-N-acetylneuraminic acid synthetase